MLGSVEVVKVSSGPQLVRHLRGRTDQRSSVVVADVYGDAWGPCTPLLNVFQDITNAKAEADDGSRDVELSFLQVNASAILRETHALESTRRGSHWKPSPREEENQQQEQADEDEEQGPTPFHCTPEFWRIFLEEQEDKSRPLVLIYRNGALSEKVVGCRSPYLSSSVMKLLKCDSDPQTFLQDNPLFLEQWQSVFGRQVEVSWHDFLKAINVWCLLPPDTPVLASEEEETFLRALKPDAEKKQRVHVQWVGKWLQRRSFVEAFSLLFPNHAERVASEEKVVEADPVVHGELVQEGSLREEVEEEEEYEDDFEAAHAEYDTAAELKLAEQAQEADEKHEMSGAREEQNAQPPLHGVRSEVSNTAVDTLVERQPNLPQQQTEHRVPTESAEGANKAEVDDSGAVSEENAVPGERQACAEQVESDTQDQIIAKGRELPDVQSSDKPTSGSSPEEPTPQSSKDAGALDKPEEEPCKEQQTGIDEKETARKDDEKLRALLDEQQLQDRDKQMNDEQQQQSEERHDELQRREQPERDEQRHEQPDVETAHDGGGHLGERDEMLHGDEQQSGDKSPHDDKLNSGEHCAYQQNTEQQNRIETEGEQHEAAEHPDVTGSSPGEAN